jgi:DNA (cytosine-5)-methyltransferase 1
MKKKLTFIDLFAGAGGLSEGFLMTNKFEGLAHVEWEMPMVETLRKRLYEKWNHSLEDTKKRVVHFDIQKTEELINGKWLDETKRKYSRTNHESIITNGIKGLIGKQKVNLIIGGPPCQAYSIAGRAQDKYSMKDDYRNYLFESFVEVVNEFKPDVFVFENVPGLLSACPGGILVTERIYKAFEDIGYEIRNPKKLKLSIYTASDFGVPQKRNRIIIIGVRINSKIKLESLYDEINKLKNVAVRQNVYDSIGKLPQLVPLKESIKKEGKNLSHTLKGSLNIPQHEPRFHNNRDVKIFKNWLAKDMNSKGLDEKIAFYNNLMGKNSKHAKYRNLEWDKPSPTIVAHLYKDGLMFIHPDEKQARTITVREAALLQSFPIDFNFIGSAGHCYKMIGNAVPPILAKNIAFGISKIINKK